jgi:hypothetical protein
MYAGPNYAGGRALQPGETPSADDWRVRPIGFLDDVTRNHDINYTYIEKVYTGNDPASQTACQQALWQADKEMLGNMLRYQPGNWLEAQYREAAVKAFVAKADLSYRPAVDVVGEWNRELADIDPKFPALRSTESGHAQWNPLGLVHAGATYTSTGMEALSTSGVNVQAAMLFNPHIRPGSIAPQHGAPLNSDGYDPAAAQDHSRRILVPKQDPINADIFTAEGRIGGKRIEVTYDAKENKLVRSVYSGDQIESVTTYNGERAPEERGGQYGFADFEVSRQDFVNGVPKGDPVMLPPVIAPQTPTLQESGHTQTVTQTVVQGTNAQYPDKPTPADRAWHSGERAALPPQPDEAATPPKPAEAPAPQTPEPASPGERVAEISRAAPAWPTPHQATQAQHFKAQLGPKLAQLGIGEQQINTLAAAVAKEQTRYAWQGEAQAFYLSKDGNTIALRQAWPPLREFDIAQALGQSERAHWQEAVALGERERNSADHRVLVSAAEPDRSARQAA